MTRTKSNRETRKRTANSNPSPLYRPAETWAFLSLRLFLSLVFLTAALGKFRNPETGYSFSNYYDEFLSKTSAAFANTHLPGFLTLPFLHLIGYLEIVLSLSFFWTSKRSTPSPLMLSLGLTRFRDDGATPVRYGREDRHLLAHDCGGPLLRPA